MEATRAEWGKWLYKEFPLANSPRTLERTRMIERQREARLTQTIRILFSYHSADTFPRDDGLTPTIRSRSSAPKRESALRAKVLHVSPTLSQGTLPCPLVTRRQSRAFRRRTLRRAPIARCQLAACRLRPGNGLTTERAIQGPVGVRGP